MTVLSNQTEWHFPPIAFTKTGSESHFINYPTALVLPRLLDSASVLTVSAFATCIWWFVGYVKIVYFNYLFVHITLVWIKKFWDYLIIYF